jgi:Zn-dependent oligopeptidase
MHSNEQNKVGNFTNQNKRKTLKMQTGVEYRQKVLSRGGSVDADEMLLAFLGRAPTQDAFLEQLGLVASTTP